MIKLITNFRVLLRLAKAVAVAERNGDREQITRTQAEHDQYRELCLQADEMSTGIRYEHL